MKSLITALLLATLLCAGAAASDLTETLLEADQSWNGGEFSYPEGSPQVTAVRMELEPDETTPWHCHPVPNFGYVLNGSLEVITADGDRTHVEQGDPLVEVMRTVHRGHVIEGPVEIVIFYAGARDLPTTVLADAADSEIHCD